MAQGIAGWKATLQLGGKTLGVCRTTDETFQSILADSGVRSDLGWQGRTAVGRAYNFSGEALHVNGTEALEAILLAQLNDQALAFVATDGQANGFTATGSCLISNMRKGAVIDDVQMWDFDAESDGVVDITYGSIS